MSPHVRQKSRTAGTNCTRSVQDREHACHQKAILKETQRKTTLPVDITSSHPCKRIDLGRPILQDIYCGELLYVSQRKCRHTGEMHVQTLCHSIACTLRFALPNATRSPFLHMILHPAFLSSKAYYSYQKLHCIKTL